MDNAQIIRDAVREKAQIITGLNRSVWEYAELGYQETKSAAAIIKALEDDGFTVTKELAGIPTAFKAVWGSGSPVVGILGEYDALPGLSQKAGVAAPEPDEGHTTGHGCEPEPWEPPWPQRRIWSRAEKPALWYFSAVPQRSRASERALWPRPAASTEWT